MIKFMIAALLTGTYGAIPFILDGYLNPESGKFIFITFLESITFSEPDYQKIRIDGSEKNVLPEFYEPLYHYYDKK